MRPSATVSVSTNLFALLHSVAFYLCDFQRGPFTPQTLAMRWIVERSLGMNNKKVLGPPSCLIEDLGVGMATNVCQQNSLAGPILESHFWRAVQGG